MIKKKAIFVAATGQNVGKTTLCLGMIAALKKRYSSVGFIKPVGQRHVKVDDKINVDKDVVLFKSYFQLAESWSNMSPVIVPAGFTRSYLDQDVSEKELLKSIHASFNQVTSRNDYTIVEGTGHVGVGSIFNLNNARVAAELGLDMILIASAGLGSAIDELALNINMCRQFGVTVQGIILNRVMPDKRDMLLNYFPKALKSWGIPLIGAVPYSELLSYPTMQDFESLFNTSLLAGQNHRARTFSSSRLVAGSLESYEQEKHANELVITPASREEIIERVLQQSSGDFCGGLIITGKPAPSAQVLECIRQSDVPVLYAPLCSYDAMKSITSFTTKISIKDLPKIELAIQLVEQHVEMNKLSLQ